MALKAKNKSGLINGHIDKPKESGSNYNKWEKMMP